MSAVPLARARIIVLWVCTGLFFLRVIGQVEVLLLAPPWLPPMSAWYSGLLPYPILLPAQIAILMAMSVVVFREMHVDGNAHGQAHWRPWVRRAALVYFVGMVLRLAIQLLRGADDVIAAGGIPVAFHWVLALFLMVLSRTDRR